MPTEEKYFDLWIPFDFSTNCCVALCNSILLENGSKKNKHECFATIQRILENLPAFNLEWKIKGEIVLTIKHLYKNREARLFNYLNIIC